jgi:hypothetical protein
MELDLIVAIREAKGLTVCQKSILYALASRGNNAYPNQSLLMEDSGIGSRNTLIKTIKDLEKLGWITVTKKKHGSNQYKNNRYKVHAPKVNKVGTKSDETVVNIDALKVNKDKEKINISIKSQGKTGFSYTNMSSFLAESPVSGVYNKEINNG